MTATIYSLEVARRNRLKRAAIDEAREAKAAKIVKYIDAFMRKVLATHDSRSHAEMYRRESVWVLANIKLWNDAEWWRVGQAAGLSKFPSEDTKALVIAHYAWASENTVEMRVT